MRGKHHEKLEACTVKLRKWCPSGYPNSRMEIGQVDLFGSQMHNNDIYLQITSETQETHVLELSSK